MVKQTFALKNVSFPRFPFGGAEGENIKKTARQFSLLSHE